MKKALAVLLFIAVAGGAVAQRVTGVRNPKPKQEVEEVDRAGDALRGLTAEQLAAFRAGRNEFGRNRTAATGLGPNFNRSSCVVCHASPGVGGISVFNVTRFGRIRSGAFDGYEKAGGSLLQQLALGPTVGVTRQFKSERIPEDASIVVVRRTQPLFGLGLVDATPDSTFYALAAAQAARNRATAGRVSMVDNRVTGTKTVGKFGWKAQIATLFEFAGAAYVDELGVTNPDFPNENCPNGDCSEMQFNPAPGLNDDGKGVRALTDFMMMLAPPPRGAITEDAQRGEQIFMRIGCADCHVPTLETGSHPVAALANKIYHPYSDFLLHDMGTLGDGISQANADRREMRTAPLWGLHSQRFLLHDARFQLLNMEEAIIRHDGQARTSRQAFEALDSVERTHLILFLHSL